MPTQEVQAERVSRLNNNPVRDARYVLYWMQNAQRARCNHALAYATNLANRLHRPLLVFFGITDRFPEANLRHYKFMLEGLSELQRRFADSDVGFVARQVSPEEGAVKLSKQACAVIVDQGYLRVQRLWRSSVASMVRCPLIQVETDVVVPVRTTSTKEEYSAATIRRKIASQLRRFLVPAPEPMPEVAFKEELESLSLRDVDRVLRSMDVDVTVREVEDIRGGEASAQMTLRSFLKALDHYPESRNDPNLRGQSGLSPYLHFGQISPLDVALEVLGSKSPSSEAFLEELIVRRELSMNFVYYNEAYDSYDCLPEWAKRTLAKHARDRRPYTYSLGAMESAKTHDEFWNAAQRQMLITGKMHGYMRMYWGKKILEWTTSPRDGYRVALYLNNKYELDGRDPNGFAGVAWCFGKHDRPWADRKVFGTVRYMSADGLNRKFDADAYVRRWR